MANSGSAPFANTAERIVAARIMESANTGNLFSYPPGGIYYAKADETPSKIAKSFGVDLQVRNS